MNQVRNLEDLPTNSFENSACGHLDARRLWCPYWALAPILSVVCVFLISQMLRVSRLNWLTESTMKHTLLEGDRLLNKPIVSEDSESVTIQWSIESPLAWKDYSPLVAQKFMAEYVKELHTDDLLHLRKTTARELFLIRATASHSAESLRIHYRLVTMPSLQIEKVPD